MKEINLKELLEAGCHFGHQCSRWNPKASPYIFGVRSKIHIIDLAKTKQGLEKAAGFIKDLVRDGKEIVFVGTKRQARGVLAEVSRAVGAPFLADRWIGGFLTNWEEIRKNFKKMERLVEDIENKEGKWKKREVLFFNQELIKMKRLYGGVSRLTEKPIALFLVDIKKEKNALREAKQKGVSVVAICDTNVDPTLVDYVIPANDDAVGSISFVVRYLGEAYKEGRALYEKAEERSKKVSAFTAPPSSLKLRKGKKK